MFLSSPSQHHQFGIQGGDRQFFANQNLHMGVREVSEYGWSQMLESFENKDQEGYFRNMAWWLQNLPMGILAPIQCTFPSSAFQADIIVGHVSGGAACQYSVTPAKDCSRIVASTAGGASCTYNSLVTGKEFGGKPALPEHVPPLQADRDCTQACQQFAAENGTQHVFKTTGKDASALWCQCEDASI